MSDTFLPYNHNGIRACRSQSYLIRSKVKRTHVTSVTPAPTFPSKSEPSVYATMWVPSLSSFRDSSLWSCAALALDIDAVFRLIVVKGVTVEDAATSSKLRAGEIQVETLLRMRSMLVACLPFSYQNTPLSASSSGVPAPEGWKP